MKRICIYLEDKSKQQTIESILTNLHLPVHFLNELDACQTIGYIMGLTHYTKKEHTAMPAKMCELMILHEVTDDEITHMNTLLREQHIVIPRKAMLTKHNKDWLLIDLMQEIEMEHQYFKIRDDIMAILKASSSLQIEHYTKASWSVYEKAFFTAYEAIMQKSTKSLLQEHLLTLQTAKQNLEKIEN